MYFDARAAKLRQPGKLDGDANNWWRLVQRGRIKSKSKVASIRARRGACCTRTKFRNCWPGAALPQSEEIFMGYRPSRNEIISSSIWLITLTLPAVSSNFCFGFREHQPVVS